MRHYTRLSQNFAIDSGLYPLGSCTMKHNPRLNEKMARLPIGGRASAAAGKHDPGRPEADRHPGRMAEDPDRHAGGCHDPGSRRPWRAVRHDGDPIRPGGSRRGRADGRHGCWCRNRPMAQIRRLPPLSAHRGSIPADDRGRVDLAAFRDKLGLDVAAIMLTNPNTCGLFETDIKEIADALHEAGGSIATAPISTPSSAGCDPAISASTPCISTCTRPSPRPMAVVVRGRGRWCCPRRWRPTRRCRRWCMAPTGCGWWSTPTTRRHRQDLRPHEGLQRPDGHVHPGASYILSHGADGLWQVSGDAVLNANYVMASLQDVMTPSFDGPCMHEVLFDDRSWRIAGSARWTSPRR